MQTDNEHHMTGGAGQDESAAGERKRNRNGNREVVVTPCMKQTRGQREPDEEVRGAAAALTHRTMVDLPLFWHQNRGRVSGEKHLHVHKQEREPARQRDLTSTLP